MGPRSPLHRPATAPRVGRRTATVLAASATALVAAPAAGAAVHTGQIAGGPAGGAPPGRTISDLAVSYDDAAGTLTGTVTMAGAPAAGDTAVVTIHLGTPDGSTCAAPQALIATALGGTDAAAGESGSGAQFGATRTTDGSRVTVTSTAPQLVGLGYRCFWARVKSGDAIVTETNGWGRVTTATPPPAPTPPTPAPAPVPAPPPVPAPSPPKAPKLAVTVTGVPRTVAKGRWYAARVRVKNVGTRQATKVRLSAARLSGVQLRSRTASWRSIKVGKSVSTRVRVRMTGSLPQRTVKVGVTGSSKLTAAATIVLRRKVAAPKPTPAGKGGPLAGRYWWGFVSHTDRAWDNRGVWFTDGKWAYVGLPQGGLPRCTGPKPTLNDEGKPTGDGCVAYTLNERTGTLRVGDLRGTFRKGALELDDVRLTELAVPKAGSRFAVNLIHRGFNGLCGLVLGCTTYSESLALNQDGTFARASSSISSSGGSGTGVPYVNVSSFPPNQHGTYEILSAGRARFAYADGTVRVQTIGIDRNTQGRPDPATGGILLNDTNFYPDSD
ncbi:hypothetical protein [Patulibacter minatonensis]|uniref:hypothetical protein n=1 Tax=Patulibacter minatonensis TaxID=298163 RepID=UPI00047E1A66|nr:hypothetical protein [Patulibacter minatonensis]